MTVSSHRLLFLRRRRQARLGGSVSNIDVHATNVIGIGARQVFTSLMPALMASSKIQRVYVSPNIEDFARSLSHTDAVEIVAVQRFLPKIISRFLECTIFSYRFRRDSILLVLGDLPLRVKGRQIVLVQNAHLVRVGRVFRLSEWYFIVARLIFAANSTFVSAFVVQSEVMREELEKSYPAIRGRVYVVPPPPPGWLTVNRVVSRRDRPEAGLKLFYPASRYPHKNHAILRKMQSSPQLEVALCEIILTVTSVDAPSDEHPFIRCVGQLSPEQVMQFYETSDALLFLSRKESFGFPLLEAMKLGLPILCPDLPYARWMCGSEAVYFDVESPYSLRAGIVELHARIISGWRPNWAEALSKFPMEWDECAVQFIKICLDVPIEDTSN
jgi:glycosyltransferase involved in cell wall biosynthesis